MKRQLLAVLVIVAAVTIGISIVSALAQDSDVSSPGYNSPSLQTIKDGSRKAQQAIGRLGDVFLVAGIDIVLSGICLVIAILMHGRQFLKIKAILWMLFAFNVAGPLLFVLFKAVWLALNYFVIRLEPARAEPISGVMLPCFVAASGILYLWLLARSFQAGFLGSLKVMLVSQALCLSLLWAIPAVLPAKNDSNLIKALRDNMNLQAQVDKYKDQNLAICGKASFTKAFYVRAYHI